MRLDEVPAVFTAARFLWPGDRSIARKSDSDEDGMARAWHRHLGPFAVDQVTAAMDSLLASTSMDRCPSLGVLAAECRAIEHREKPDLRVQHGGAIPESVVPPSLNPYRAKLRADLIRFHTRADRTMPEGKLAEIDAEVAWVGPREAAYLAQHGIDVAVTMPEQQGGNAVQAEAVTAGEPEPLPATDAELADAYALRWLAADAEGREQMRDEAASFTPELRDAVNAAVVARRKQGMGR